MAETFVEAAMNGQDGSQQAHFFLADHYVTYNWTADRVVDGVHPVSDWGVPATFTPPPTADTTPELPGIDAAIKGRERFKDFGYLFKGTNYVRARFGPPRLDGTGVLSAWHLPGAALASGIDGAFSGRLSRDGKAYFFKGNQYDRYDWKTDTGDKLDPNGLAYPRPISNMVGMPADFASGVSAAVDGDGRFVQFGYLFRADHYLRFQWVPGGSGQPHVDGTSTRIHKTWPGLVELLLAGKAKAKALVWIRAAQAALAAAAAGGFTPLVNAALSTHFHIAPGLSLAAKQPLIAQIQATYAAVTTTLGKSATVFRFRTDTEATTLDNTQPFPAYTFLGRNVNFTEHFAERRRMARAAIVLHEAVHFTDATSGTRTATGALAIDIPEWYVTDAQANALGLPVQPNRADLAVRYDAMNTTQAVHNPSAYAAFAQHIAIGADTRFGDANQGPE
jgi:hypothetical protein